MKIIMTNRDSITTYHTSLKAIIPPLIKTEYNFFYLMNSAIAYQGFELHFPFDNKILPEKLPYNLKLIHIKLNNI